ncbi:MAG: TAXI family TRAP transporter solute-binding subunit [Eubacteriales bacterium]|nr:TAXI family TRAP transporter solute-binding subunit [Eubacteriales bacterium]
MKKFVSLVLAVMLVLCAVPALATTYLGLATGGTTGTYYALGGDIAALWMAKIADLDVTAQTTGGSKANIILINEGDAELGTVQNDVMSYAYAGDQDFFEGQVIDSFVAIGALYPELVQIVVGADSDIKTIADLKDKSVSIGAVGSGVYFNAIQILGNAGLTLDDVNEQYLSFDESATAFQNNQVDAFFITAGLPNTSIVEVANKRNVRLLGLDEADMAKLMETYAYYTPVTVAAGTYNGMDADVTVPAVSAVLICSKDLDEDMVYNLTKTLYEDTAELSHAKKSEISAENAVKGIPVPFHPGAEKYFVEKGLLTK